MGFPAARVGDPHVCPMFTVLVPHVGGVVMPPGCPTVMIGGQPAAVVGGMCACATGPPAPIMMGSMGVFFGGMPAARMTSLHGHGGTIVMGFPAVLIGDIGVSILDMLMALVAILLGLLDLAAIPSSAVSGALAGAAPVCAAGTAGAAAGGGLGPPPPCPMQRHFFKAKLTLASGDPAVAVAYDLKLPDGKIRKGHSRNDGMVVEFGLPAGNCELTLTDLDKDSWTVES